MSQVSLVDRWREHIRVLDPAGNLAFLVSDSRSNELLASGAFRAVRRKKRTRAIVPIPEQIETAQDLLRDLERVTYDKGRVVRCGYAHRLETDDNPKGVLTISRIPASLRDIFTTVVDDCLTSRAA